MTIYFDMDGTIANLYAVENWLPKLRNEDASPYTEAAPLVRLCTLARLLNKAQRNGHKIGIVSWLAKNASENYDIKVTNAKIEWLNRHLRTVNFDEVLFVPYTYEKNNANNGEDILFDDEDRHLTAWTGTAYPAREILERLKAIA